VQAIGLHHNGRVEDLDSFLKLGRGRANGIVCRGNVVPLHKSFGESLAGLQHGCGACWAENAEAALLQGVHNTQRKRQLRPHDGHPRLLGQSNTHHRVQALQVHRNTPRNLGDAAVAGSANHLGNSIAALYRPGQRMFAASRTQNENFHSLLNPPKGYGRQ
jgi:hypothetical protein